jgi:hypothetical protein
VAVQPPDVQVLLPAFNSRAAAVKRSPGSA